MIRRATPADAATLARLNAHVQGWHAAQYPEAFFPNPDPVALTAYFADRLADSACTAFVTGDPALGYALCALQTRDTSVFSPGYRRLMIDQIAVVPEARATPNGRSIPILILTTESEVGKKNEGRAAGATGWIVKPFQQEQLLAVVSRVLPGAVKANAA